MMASTRIEQRLSLPLETRFEDCIVHPRSIVLRLGFVLRSFTSRSVELGWLQRRRKFHGFTEFTFHRIPRWRETFEDEVEGGYKRGKTIGNC